MTRGFLLGKFLPPHAGHRFLAQVAAGLCDELTVLVCSLPDDPIPGSLRHGWMTAMLPGVRVLHHDRIVPQEPADHPDFWPIWRRICLTAQGGPIDVVFGSEPYVHRLAAEVGARPVLIDPERLAFPTSGTAVRRNPPGQWRFLPPEVRPHFQRRIVLVGAESVGKSTMAQSLAAEFDTLYVPEYGRVHDAHRAEGPWTEADFAQIMAGHRAMRRALAGQAGPVLFEDTDPLLTQVWQGFLTGQAPTEPPPDLADLYFVLDIDRPWIDDGTRYQGDPAARAAFQAAVLAQLDRFGANRVLITGDWAERRALCIRAVSRLLGSSARTGT
ncbi:AAA family ATPase [Stagnihabitans tardus]|uniref:AAA family ATPase n=1 Tax=Stagnihabitans tardus TaxID=2699202 RepID=A0AAE5BXC8_9RHOB|nr:AAA family ATPase [Stagnihabitans tardus]